jgi:hypothetical protein
VTISDWIIEKVGLDRSREPPFLFPGNRWNWLPDLCNEFGLKVGAEVGVGGGRFSERLLKTVPGLLLNCVDPWESYDYYEGRISQFKMEHAYHKALEKLQPFGAKCAIVREYSQRAVLNFDDGSLDFVYIDANRSYGAVWDDLTAWSRKVVPGGLVVGCCYYDERDSSVGQVKAAVNDWMMVNEADPWFVLVHHRYPCYLWER